MNVTCGKLLVLKVEPYRAVFLYHPSGSTHRGSRKNLLSIGTVIQLAEVQPCSIELGLVSNDIHQFHEQLCSSKYHHEMVAERQDRQVVSGHDRLMHLRSLPDSPSIDHGAVRVPTYRSSISGEQTKLEASDTFLIYASIDNVGEKAEKI